MHVAPCIHRPLQFALPLFEGQTHLDSWSLELHRMSTPYEGTTPEKTFDNLHCIQNNSIAGLCREQHIIYHLRRRLHRQSHSRVASEIRGGTIDCCFMLINLVKLMNACSFNHPLLYLHLKHFFAKSARSNVAFPSLPAVHTAHGFCILPCCKFWQRHEPRTAF